MRYIADSNGYILQLSFGADVSCNGMHCTEYKGSVPAGYSSLCDWYDNAADELYRWKIVNGNLTYDAAVEPPKGPEEVDVADFIVERNEEAYDGIAWTWEKWNSGKAVCWGQKNYGSLDATSAWGSVYETPMLTALYPPGLFIEAPSYRNLTYMGTDKGLIAYSYNAPDKTNGSPSKDAVGGFQLFRATASRVGNVTVGFHAIGKWK